MSVLTESAFCSVKNIGSFQTDQLLRVSLTCPKIDNLPFLVAPRCKREGGKERKCLCGQCREEAKPRAEKVYAYLTSQNSPPSRLSSVLEISFLLYRLPVLTQEGISTKE